MLQPLSCPRGCNIPIHYTHKFCKKVRAFWNAKIGIFFFHCCPTKRNQINSKSYNINIICHALVYEGLSVPKAHNPINPALNTVGVQCGEIVLIPMRVEDTPQHDNQQSSVPTARRIWVSVPAPHGTPLRVGLIGLSAFSTFIGR